VACRVSARAARRRARAIARGEACNERVNCFADGGARKNVGGEGLRG
jgi:hypothetical protein